MSNFGGFGNSPQQPQPPTFFGGGGFPVSSASLQHTQTGIFESAHLGASTSSSVPFGSGPNSNTSAFGVNSVAATSALAVASAGSGFSSFGTVSGSSTQQQFGSFGSALVQPFGQQQTSTTTGGPFSFGNNNAQSSISPGGGGIHFGVPSSTGSVTPFGGNVGGSIFGSPVPGAFQAPQGGAVFGASPPPPFGTATTTVAPQQQHPSNTGNSFGGSNLFGTISGSNTFQNTGSNNFAFGGSRSNAPPTINGAGVFYGNQSAASTGGGLFGNAPTTFGEIGNNNVGGGVFGSLSNNPSLTGIGNGVVTSSSTPFFGNFSLPSSTPFGAQPPAGLPGQQQLFNAGTSSSVPLFGSSLSTNNKTSSNPFGGGTQSQQNSSMAFGASTNVVSTESSGFGNSGGLFRSNTNYSGSGNSNFHPFLSSNDNNNQQSDLDMRSLSPVPYGNVSSSGPSPQSMSPMRSGQSDSEAEMGDGEQESKKSSNLPFGKPVASGTFGGTSSWGSSAFIDDKNTGTNNSLSPIPEMEGSMEDSIYASSIPSSINAHNAKLAELKAKLEQKRKKLEDKRKQEDEKQDEAEPDKESSSKAKLKKKNTSKEANAIRFAGNSSSESRSQQQQQQQTSTEREDLENAISLVGTCLTMCPDEEIARRERESDIQLLEKPLPVTIHPSHWTLKDTMVKRFRRSAADYKLDVPEWVRPPDVLERVCGYLEEWVMERDRQGPDQRFIDSEFNFKHDGTPPSLDVYQFIWDRTRMVRKDFILQNYVGTGGNCDARAVRCHERIARWHAMCEHQLSHIPEFATQQSQQNIQELGQTMKTLNQYYDDTMNRSIVEVPDEHGNETRTDLSTYNHGCCSNVVQGRDPIDFDRRPLMNNDDSPDPNSRVRRRLIGGTHAVTSPHHGTAEPEMRGLYILLTLENDGGMEVLKYAGRLYQLRPEIYRTIPVQLALNVYKARKEYNYARFFSILRSPATPYLFACVMFKYVEVMRKLALRIMCKTYGGKNRDNAPIYDEYALQDLIHLLCFEDADDARATCRHYNITVKITEGIETVYWKQSSFRDPKDPDKGTTLRLPPRKMIRTIESKMQDVTRLAICRGEVSGDGAFIVDPRPLAGTAQTPLERAQQEHERQLEFQRQQDLVKEREEAEAIRHQEEEDAKRKEIELKQQLEIQRKRLEEEELHKKEIQRKLEQEEQERAERRRVEQELERQRKEQEVKAEKQRIEEAEKARQLELLRIEAIRRHEVECTREEQKRMEQLRLAEEEELRRKHQEALRKEEAECLRRREEDAENSRKEQVRIRMEELLREQEEQKRLAAERLRLQHECQSRNNVAKKKIAFLRWLQKLPRHMCVKNRMASGFDRISPIAESCRPLDFSVSKKKTKGTQQGAKNWNYSTDLRRNIEFLLQEEFSLASHLASCVASEFRARLQSKTALLFKIAIVLPPMTENDRVQGFCDLIRTWINTRLCFRHVMCCTHETIDVRVVVVDSHDKQAHPYCDAAVFIVPPPWSDFTMDTATIKKDLKVMSSSVDDSIPRVVFALHEHFHPWQATECKNIVGRFLSGSYEEVLFIENTDCGHQTLDSCIFSTCELVAQVLGSTKPFVVERATFGQLILNLLSDEGWFDCSYARRDDILTEASSLLHLFMEELDIAVSEIQYRGTTWPSPEFAMTHPDRINDYFESGHDLRVDWISTLSWSYLQEAFSELIDILDSPFQEAIWKLLRNAPFIVQSKFQLLIDHKNHGRCLRMALEWKVEHDDRSDFNQVVYIDRSLVFEVLQTARSKLQARKMLKTPKVYSATKRLRSSEPVALEEIDLPPKELGLQITQDAKNSAEFIDSSINVEQGNHFSNERSEERIKQHSEAKRRVSHSVQESINFTKRLRKLLAGEEIEDMLVGTFTLGSALKGAPPLHFTE